MSLLNARFRSFPYCKKNNLKPVITFTLFIYIYLSSRKQVIRSKIDKHCKCTLNRLTLMCPEEIYFRVSFSNNLTI
jgi:hypothetical protein